MGNGVAHGMERTKPLYPAPVGALLARPMAAFEIQRAVRFEEVDAARIVFFARYLGYGHEAMEAFFGALEGGYHGLVDGRGIGFPAVHVDATYEAPLRFGDTITIRVDVTKLGTTSCTFRYVFVRQDGVRAATLLHTCVCCELAGEPKKSLFPPDVRARLEAHLVAP